MPQGDYLRCTGGMFKGQLERGAVILFMLVRIVFWFGVAGLLHYKKWYWAL